MQIFLLVNGNYQHGVLRIQQLFGDFQPLLHKRQPLAVAVLVVIVHIVVVVFPVPRTGVVGRVYVHTDFDTKEKALSGAKAAEKGLK